MSLIVTPALGALRASLPFDVAVKPTATGLVTYRRDTPQARTLCPVRLDSVRSPANFCADRT